MPRSRSRVPTATIRVAAHPALLDADLGQWAGERIALGGRRDALLGRVETLRISVDGRRLDARVRGNRPLPYRTQVEIAGDHPRATCTCSVESRAPCRHAVAAIETLRFPVPEPAESSHPPRRPPRRGGPGRGRIVRPAQAGPGILLVGGAERTRGRDQRIAAARADEILARQQRAARERGVVRPLPTEGGPLRFEVTVRPSGERHEVTLRSSASAAQLPACTCADFRENELVTCQHVERVRRWRARQRKADRSPLATGVASLWWSPRVWLEGVPQPLRELRIDLPVAMDPPALGRFFEEEGWLRPPEPGVGPSSWAREAAAAFRATAAASGWFCDIAAEVGACIEAAAAVDPDTAARRAERDFAALWPEVRAGLGLGLHPYQEQGVRFLAATGRALLADDMGLGKTVQAVAAGLLLRRTAGVERVLVVCPASLKHQWSREIERVCGERASLVDGPRARRLAIYAAWRRGFLVVNYELVVRDLEPIRAAAPELVILDEAQRIKNWETRTAQCVKRLDAPRAFVLTGTPLENRLAELHSLAEFLRPRALGPRWRLLPFHLVTEQHGRVIACEGLDVLRRRLAPFFLRRERTRVLDQLPERTDNTFWTNLSPAQRRPYRKHRARVAAILAEGRRPSPAQVRALLQSLTQMRILCNALAQHDWERVAARLADPAPPSRPELRELGSPKLEEFVRVLEDLLDQSERKIVVFSQWLRALRLAEFVSRDVLARRDLRTEIFHGGLGGGRRTEVLDAFRADPEFRVLLSTDAGGLGLNLQDAASIVVHLEVPWNPAVLEQRVGRVHRMGQRESVQVLHFVTRGAIEERVRRVVESKQALFDGLLASGRDRIDLGREGRASFVERVAALLAP